MQKAIVLCEGKFGTTEGKSAHGLVRYSKRFLISGVIDSIFQGKDAGQVLDGKPNGIPFFGSLDEALRSVPDARCLIVGVATDGGRLLHEYRGIVKEAIESGMNIINGLHEYISDDRELCELAREKSVHIVDIRKLAKGSHFFTGEIESVRAVKIAVLGTDSAIGKRTTALILKSALNSSGLKTVFIGTGQTSWMQGERYVSIMDSTLNDYVSGELEHTVVRAYRNEKPDVIIIEGQGSILHPAYPGGFEIISSTKPDAIILQHSPKRLKFDGFNKYYIPSLRRFILILEKLSDKKVIAITLNHEKIRDAELTQVEEEIEHRFRIPAADLLRDGPDKVVNAILHSFPSLKNKVHVRKNLSKKNPS
jgi:uncharacterized NAD-dependent epimerase/dehydratase family protein